MLKLPTYREQGFTLLEMIMAMSAIGIFIVLSSTLLVLGFRELNRNETQIGQQSEAKLAIESITNNLKSAQAVRINNLNPDGGSSDYCSWKTQVSEPQSLVLSVAAIDSAGRPKYKPGSSTETYTDDTIIYYEPSDNTLRRFTIPSTLGGDECSQDGPGGCVGCGVPENHSANAKVLTDGIRAFSLELYDAAGNVTADAEFARSVKIVLTIRGERAREAVQLSTRATLRNR